MTIRERLSGRLVRSMFYLCRPFSEDQCMVFDHGINVEAMHRHQVQVAKLVRGSGDAGGEGVLRVNEEDAGRPVPCPDQGQEILGIIGGQIKSVDNVEIILRYRDIFTFLNFSYKPGQI